MRPWFVLAICFAACRRDETHVTADEAPKKTKPAEKAEPAPPPSATLPDEAELIALAGGKSANPEAVEKAVLVSRPAMKRCFTKELATDPGAGGKVTVSITVDATGAVTDAVAETTSASKSLTACVVDACRKLKFKPGSGTTKVLVPFVFKGG